MLNYVWHPAPTRYSRVEFCQMTTFLSNSSLFSSNLIFLFCNLFYKVYAFLFFTLYLLFVIQSLIQLNNFCTFSNLLCLYFTVPPFCDRVWTVNKNLSTKQHKNFFPSIPWILELYRVGAVNITVSDWCWSLQEVCFRKYSNQWVLLCEVCGFCCWSSLFTNCDCFSLD